MRFLATVSSLPVRQPLNSTTFGCGHLHCLLLERFDCAVAELVDPWNRCKAKVNNQVKDVVAVDLDAVTMVLSNYVNLCCDAAVLI
jgi:hypothetical protein